MAHVLNISQSKYSRLEKGEISFNIDELSKLLDYLELNPLEVLEKQQVFMAPSYSGNNNTTINNIDNIELIKKIVQEELKKQ